MVIDTMEPFKIVSIAYMTFILTYKGKGFDQSVINKPELTLLVMNLVVN